jgi:hypothetical protein
LKLRAIILQVGDNRKESGWAYVVLNPAQNLRAVRIGEIEYHHPQGLASIAAQRARVQIWPVPQLASYFPNSIAGALGNAVDPGAIV